MKYVKHTKRRMTRTIKVLLIILCVVLALNVAVVAAVLRVQKQEQPSQLASATQPQPSISVPPSSEATQPTQIEESEPQQVYIVFPYTSEDGKLMISSIFQFSGNNPDSNDAEGENIAGIELKNVSDSHLTKADITAIMADGTALQFAVWDLPPGASMIAFSTDNLSVDDVKSCETIICEALFTDESPLMADQIAIEVAGTEVEVTNISDEDLTNVTVYCHCSLVPEFFGGLTYSYEIESLPAGECVTVDAWECYMGEAVVVRIEQNG